jgi:replication factor A2
VSKISTFCRILICSCAAIDFYGNSAGGGYLTGGSPFGGASGSPGGFGRVRSTEQCLFALSDFLLEGSAFSVPATHHGETIYPSYASPRGCGLDVRKYRARPCALSLEYGSFCILSTSQVTLVAHVVSVQKQATNCVYMLDDGTGTLEARHWSDSVSQDGEDSQDEVV